MNALLRPRVLFVDDEESLLFACRDYFHAEGYDVGTARDPNEADAILSLQPYDVAIIDLSLGLNYQTAGLELVRRVRERHPMMSVVLFTAFCTADIAHEARGLGATFLEKPVPLPILRSVIDALARSWW